MTTVAGLLIFSFLYLLLLALNVLVWIRPSWLLPKNTSAISHSGVATVLALSLFLVTFFLGMWISILKLRGDIGVII